MMLFVPHRTRLLLDKSLKFRLWYADIVSVFAIIAAIIEPNGFRLAICGVAIVWYALGVIEWYLGRRPKSS